MVALNRDQAIARIQQGLGFRADQAASILLELRLKQTELEEGQTLPWWLEQDATLLGTAGTDNVSLPETFIRFVEDTALRLDTDQSQKMTMVDYDDLLHVGADVVTGTAESGPANYVALKGQRLFVRPVPTQDYVIYCSYYQQDTDLELVGPTGSNQWLTYAPQVLIGAAGTAVARDLEYPEAEQRFLTMYQAALGRLLMDAEARKAGNRQYAVGAMQ